MPDALTGEAFYDTEIAPALAEITKRLPAGMSMVAVVEYAPGERGSTLYVDPGADMAMRMLDMLARTAPNIDAFMINLTRYAAKHGIDTSSSLIMRLMAEPRHATTEGGR